MQQAINNIASTQKAELAAGETKVLDKHFHAKSSCYNVSMCIPCRIFEECLSVVRIGSCTLSTADL